jgi:hypothetical protein
MQKRNLSALLLLGELVLITVMHVVKHNQQINKERSVVIFEQNENASSPMQINQNVVYRLNH